VAASPDDLIARERELLARVLRAAVAPTPATPRKRKIRGLRKVSEVVERTWLSVGCFGEAIQWKLKPRSGP
jgi:hypothetical protein